MRFYFRLFYRSGVPFGFVMGVTEGFFHGFQRGLIFGIATGAFFGLGMVLYLGILHKRSVERQGFEITEDTLSVRQNRILFLLQPYDEVFEGCIRALETIEKSEVKTADPSTGKIEATTGWGWKSWGEKITIEIASSEADLTGVVILSRPKMQTTLTDYGKNLENVETISNFLQQKKSQ